MKSILITNARIINEDTENTGDLYIKNGRIEAIGGDLARRTTDIVMDAAGKVIMPGMIDDQVHFREPGLTHKGNIHTESRAAVAGGITSFMDMPNTRPAAVTCEALEDKFRIAAQCALGNYSFYLGGANDNIDEIRRLDPMKSCGIKVFMGASTGNMLVDKTEILEKIFSEAPTLVATHCEDTPTITRNEAEYRARFGEDVPMMHHPDIRSAEACWESSSLAVELARRHGTRLHILHLTSARELELFSDAPLTEKRITAEVCVHHLFFSDEDYPAKGALIKCNPAIKSAADRDALVRAVINGKIDVFGTDHAPHTLEEKAGIYFKAPSGLPIAQHALPALLEHYHSGTFTLALIAEKASHAPARLFQIKDRGFIREGYWADLVLVDLDRPRRVQSKDILYHCGWSPFEGYEFKSTIEATIVSGHLSYAGGKIREGAIGKRLEFER
jgi:dihydroorotase